MLPDAEEIFRQLMTAARLISVDEYGGVMAAISRVMPKELGIALADDSPARFSLIVVPIDGRREGRLYAARDNRVHLGQIAARFRGSGTENYAVIPKLPGNWVWPGGLVSIDYEHKSVWEMT